MTTLLQRWTQPEAPEERLGLDDILALWQQSFTYNGTTYGLPQTMPTTDRGETISGDYPGIVQAAYGANGVVFACVLARLLLFSEARFVYRRMRNGRPGDLFSTADLAILDQPGQLLARAEQDVSIAGNFYLTNRGGVLRRLRPDWVEIVLGGADDPQSAEPVAYKYTPGGPAASARPVLYNREEICHYAPIPDPLARWKGMSWLTPILREIDADSLATAHKRQFFRNGATPNMVIKFDPAKTIEQVREFKSTFDEQHQGTANAYKTLFLGGGADVQVVGQSFEQMSFKTVQGSGETRIAAAAGVPPVIVGLSEGLQAATYCVPYDGQIWTLEGPRPIGELAAGDRVWSFEDGSLVPRRVVRQWRTGEKAIWKVKTKNRTLRVTDNHPVLTRVPGSHGSDDQRHATLDWRPVADLKIGDKIVQPKSLPTDPEAVTPDFLTCAMAQWFGAYVGDGCGAGGSAVRFAIPPADRVRDDYEKLTAELFPDVTIGYEERGFRFHSRDIARWLEQIGFGGIATTKQIPEWMFTAPEQYRHAFLAGLIDTDGSIDVRGVCKIQLANRRLIEQVRALFVSCGTQVSNLSSRRSPPRSPLMIGGQKYLLYGRPDHQTYDSSVLPQPGSQDIYHAWAITMSSAAKLATLPIRDDLYRERLAANADRIKADGGDAAKAGLSDDLGFYSIVGIEMDGIEAVYDIEVEGGHSYIADGVVVHNSNYAQARRRFADGTIRPLWRAFANALSTIIPVPNDAELWYDDRDIPALQEDLKDAADIQNTRASTLQGLITAGFTPDSAIEAVQNDDLTRLEHTGAISVQLYPEGQAPSPTGEPTDDTDPDVDD